MTHSNRNLGALIAARICHDLVSPVGAIANGLELLSLAGVPDGPEMALVADSAADASARLRFFRVAFSGSSDAQSMAASEIRSILAGVYNAKTTCNWQVDAPLPRRVAQAGFLALLCAEQAVPFGGVMTVQGDADALSVTATGGRLAAVPAHWALLTAPGQIDLADLPAAQVQFALLPGLLADMGRSVQVDLDSGAARLRF